MNKKEDANGSLSIMAMVSKTSPSLLSFSQSSKKEKVTAVDGDVLKAIKDACDIAELSITTVTGKVTCTQAGGKDDFLYMVDNSGTKVKASGLTALQKKDIEMTNQNKFKKCNKTDDKLCPGADIVDKEWKLTSGSNEVGEASESPYKEKSCMVCLQGGAIYFLSSGQVLGDFDEMIKNIVNEKMPSGLGSAGYKLLIDLELGTDLKNYSYIKTDKDGNITFIKNHDVGDGGITVGVGIFVKASDTERIKMLNSLNINWQDTNQWVPIETIERAFQNISKDYETSVNNFVNKYNLSVTQEQYDALFLMAYNRLAVLGNGGAVDKMVSSNNNNMIDWRNALINEYKTLNQWSKYGSGWTNRIDDELELYFNGEYEKTH